MFKLYFIALAENLFPRFAEQVVYQVLEMGFRQRDFGCFSLIFGLAAGQKLDNPVADVYLIIQIASLQEIKLPVEFGFDILVTDFSNKPELSSGRSKLLITSKWI